MTYLSRFNVTHASKGGAHNKAGASDAFGIDWMTMGEVMEAIPPAYTFFLGSQILALTPAKEGSG